MQKKHDRAPVRRDKILALISLFSSAAAMAVFAVTLVLALVLGASSSPDDGKNGKNHGDYSSDTLAPVIIGAKNLIVYKGESVAYRKNIIVTDDGGDEYVTLTVDSGKVNINKPGIYAVTYTATDRAGNSSSIAVFVTVIEPKIPIETLNAELDHVIELIINDRMNKEAKIRAVYEYVKNHISYVSYSDKNDWRAEAYSALFVTGTGDCFSFFAASKAFFERLGIENLDIQRTPNLVEETHYWSLVNISESGSAERWYHYDSTRLRAEFSHSGCLLTEKQINAFSRVREHFYAYEKSAYPAASETIITPTPELEQYY